MTTIRVFFLVFIGLMGLLLFISWLLNRKPKEKKKEEPPGSKPAKDKKPVNWTAWAHTLMGIAICLTILVSFAFFASLAPNHVGPWWRAFVLYPWMTGFLILVFGIIFWVHRRGGGAKDWMFLWFVFIVVYTTVIMNVHDGNPPANWLSRFADPTTTATTAPEKEQSTATAQPANADKKGTTVQLYEAGKNSFTVKAGGKLRLQLANGLEITSIKASQPVEVYFSGHTGDYVLNCKTLSKDGQVVEIPQPAEGYLGTFLTLKNQGGKKAKFTLVLKKAG